MSSTAKAHEPTMEEILASIRRIIADDDPGETPAAAAPAPASPAAAPAKPTLKAVQPAPPPPPAAPDAAEDDVAGMSQDDIDAMLASFDAPPLPGKDPEPESAAEAVDPWDAIAAEEEDEDEDVLELTKPWKSVPDEVEFRDPPPPPVSLPDEDDMSDWAVLPEESAASTPTRSRAPSGESLLAAEASRAVSASFGSLANTILAANARTLDDLVQEMLRPMLKDWLDTNLPAVVERLVQAEIERVSRGDRR
jgi:cell pole-organizing protein PopZ